MAVLRTNVIEGGLPRLIAPGDTLATGEVFPAAVVTNATTVTGPILVSGWYNRAITGAGTDTIDTAANIIAAISTNIGFSGVAPGLAWRFSIYNSAAFVDTVQATANTGVTVTAGTVNASSVKDFLVTVVNGTPARTVNATATNTSPTLTGVSTADLQALTVGMIITNAVAGLQGAKIISINTAAGSVTTDTNATSTANIAVNFSPVITVQGLGQKLV